MQAKPRKRTLKLPLAQRINRILERRTQRRASVKRAVLTLKKQEQGMLELIRETMKRYRISGKERKRWITLIEEIAAQNQLYHDAMGKSAIRKLFRQPIGMPELGFSIRFNGNEIRFTKDAKGWITQELDSARRVIRQFRAPE